MPSRVVPPWVSSRLATSASRKCGPRPGWVDPRKYRCVHHPAQAGAVCGAGQVVLDGPHQVLSTSVSRSAAPGVVADLGEVREVLTDLAFMTGQQHRLDVGEALVERRPTDAGPSAICAGRLPGALPGDGVLDMSSGSVPLSPVAPLAAGGEPPQPDDEPAPGNPPAARKVMARTAMVDGRSGRRGARSTLWAVRVRRERSCGCR